MDQTEIDKEYLGYVLLRQDFKTWFLYMFRILEGKPFIVEPIHDEVFELFQNIFEGNQNRVNLNVPPRAGKTTLCKYGVLYTLTKNPRSKIIYTSFNQGLLADISKEVAAMMEHPIYKAMYPQRIHLDAIEASPVDNFWRTYLEATTNKNTYTNRKITTAQGGEVLFAAIGSQITGFGAGLRGSKEFSGMLIIDDANKPADIHSQNMRDKVLRYYEETLLSRLNDSDIPILNVQQRLHIEDLSGHLIRKYSFYTLRKPLLNVDGSCNIPSQYTDARIEELKFNDSMFQAQYQQEPIAEKGLIIKRVWWQRYDTDTESCRGQIIITADTAFKETKTADYSVLQTWELRKDKMLMRDMVVGKWEFPELIQAAKRMWTKWNDANKINRVQYLFIEDKASGTPLQQTLANEEINAVAWRPQDFDYPDNKVARTKTLSWDVYRGMLYLPNNNEMSDYLINEASLFSEDMSHSHDDSVDACSMAHSIWRYYGGGQD